MYISGSNGSKYRLYADLLLSMFVNQFTYIQRDNHQTGHDALPAFSGITIVKFSWETETIEKGNNLILVQMYVGETYANIYFPIVNVQSK